MELGETGFPKYGTGNYIQELPKEDTLEFGDFSGGYFRATNRESVPDNTTPFAVDIEVTRDNRLKRSPGTTMMELFEVRTPEHMVVHGSLDFTAELLFFDPPYLGVKRLGDTVWANKGLSDEQFAWANFGGTFIFTDGVKVYARQVDDGTNLEELTEAPVALAYASWAARMWALAAVIDGNFEPLGIVWSAANSDYTDWTGLGSGNQLLIDQISSGDRGVALVPMGLDFMAVFLRKSIWIARRTGLLTPPGDLQPRVAGKGAINDQVLQATDEGVIYVCDDGVELFDGNVSTKISLAIDEDLLPLDYSKILEYTSSYNPTTGRYYLHTPAGTTWIYELKFKRWIRRSLLAKESVVWPRQAEDAVVEGEAQVVFLGDHVDESISNRAIEIEDQASEEYFGEPQTPIWTLRPTPQQRMNELLTSKQFNLEYEGVADIELWAPNNNGVYEALVLDELISQSPPDIVEIYAAKTGRLASLQLRISRGDAEFIHLQVVFTERGPRIAIGEGGIPGNFPDRTSLQRFPQGHVTPWTGSAGGPQQPSASIVATLISGRTYQFSFSGDFDPPLTDYDWDFGDGEQGTGPNPIHTFPENGSFSVTLQPISDWFWWASAALIVSVESTPIPPESYGSEDAQTGTLVSAGVGGSSFMTTLLGDFLVADSSQPPRAALNGPDDWELDRMMIAFDLGDLPAPPISGRIKATTFDVVDALSDPNGSLGAVAIEMLSYPDRLVPTDPIETDDWLASNDLITAVSDYKPTIASLSPIGGQQLTFELSAAGLAAIVDDLNFFVVRTNYDRALTSPGWTTPSGNASFVSFLRLGITLELEFE